MSVRVALSNMIYPQRCLEETIASYSTLCSVTVVERVSNARLIEITSIDEDGQSDENRVAHEFLNYLLDMSLEEHLGKA